VSRARLPGDSAQGVVRIGNYERASFLRRTQANATRPDPNKSSVPGSGTRIVSDEFLWEDHTCGRTATRESGVYHVVVEKASWAVL
jgi:hypothetical protein